MPTLDLNDPHDAREYVMSWVDNGGLHYEHPLDLLTAAPEEFLRVASQLFLKCDPRQAPGGMQ